MTERAKFKGVINLIIKDGDKTLLFFRNDGFFSYGGGARNLLPLGYERPTPKTQTKRSKTGKKQGISAKNGIF